MPPRNEGVEDLVTSVAVLHEKVNQLEAEHLDLKAGVKALLESNNRIESELGRYKGIIGGLTMVLAAVAFVASVFGDWLSSHISFTWSH